MPNKTNLERLEKSMPQNSSTIPIPKVNPPRQDTPKAKAQTTHTSKSSGR